MRPTSRFGDSGCISSIDSVGDTVEFRFSQCRDLPAAKRFFRQALDRHGSPDRVVIVCSQANYEAIVSCDTTHRPQTEAEHSTKPITIYRSQYLNNRMEQDHRAIKTCPADAWFQVHGICQHHFIRHRDDSYDAKATGEVCL